MDSKFKICLPTTDSGKMDQAERLRSINGFLVRHNARLYTTKMGEITVKLLNVFGLTTLIFGFIANLPNAISVAIGLMSLVWVMFRVLKMREDWLFRRSERRKHERDYQTNDED